MDVTLPDGNLIKGVPDGMSKADLTAKLKSNGYDISKLDAPASTADVPKASGWDDFVAGLKGGTSAQLAMGAVTHAAKLGATIMQPFQALEDKLTGKGSPTLSGLITGQQPQSSNQATRAGIDGAISELGGKPNSCHFRSAVWPQTSLARLAWAVRLRHHCAPQSPRRRRLPMPWLLAACLPAPGSPRTSWPALPTWVCGWRVVQRMAPLQRAWSIQRAPGPVQSPEQPCLRLLE